VDEGELALVADAHAVTNKAMAPSAAAVLILDRTVEPPGGVGAPGSTNVNSRAAVRESRQPLRFATLLPNRDTAGSLAAIRSRFSNVTAWTADSRFPGGDARITLRAIPGHPGRLARSWHASGQKSGGPTGPPDPPPQRRYR
jgi:hypothetical protein